MKIVKSEIMNDPSGAEDPGSLRDVFEAITRPKEEAVIDYNGLDLLPTSSGTHVYLVPDECPLPAIASSSGGGLSLLFLSVSKVISDPKSPFNGKRVLKSSPAGRPLMELLEDGTVRLIQGSSKEDTMAIRLEAVRERVDGRKG